MKYKEDRDFVFVDINREMDEGEVDKVTGIHIIKGEYKGVVYHYHKARVIEEGALAKLQFGFTIVNPGEHNIEVLKNDTDYVTIMGDILTEIMLSKVNDEQNRTDNPQEFNLQ
jgi:hypothetical protein